MSAAARPVQSYANHAKLVFGYHRVGLILVAVPAGWFTYRLLDGFTVDALMHVLLAFGVMLTAFYARSFPIGVQNRVIRNEERERLAACLPEEMRGRIHELETDQLIALRFASDEELPDLCRRVLDGELATRGDIKQAVRNWRADHQRI